MSTIEEKHAAHQEMLKQHADKKHQRREKHRIRKGWRSVIPITLI